MIILRRRSLHRLKISLKYYLKRRPKRPFFILFTARTGSTLLISYLNSIPKVSFATEILNSELAIGLPLKNVSKNSVLRHILYSINHCPYEICGAKFNEWQLEHRHLAVTELFELFPAVKLIILYRQGMADQYLSHRIAEYTWQWNHRAVPVRPLNKKLRISRDEFLKYVDRIKQFYEGILRLEIVRLNSIVISYEELASNAQKVFEEKIFPFLGVPPVRVKTTLTKQTTKHPSELVENYEEVKDLWESKEFKQEYP